MIDAPDHWVLHRNESVGFVYYGPDNMAHSSKEIETSIGVVDFHTDYAIEKSEEGSLIFTISYYPIDFADTLYSDILDEIVDSGVEATNGTLDYAADQKMQESPCRLWRISKPETFETVKSKAVIANNHVIIIQATTPKELALDERVDVFLESLRLL